MKTFIYNVETKSFSEKTEDERYFSKSYWNEKDRYGKGPWVVYKNGPLGGSMPKWDIMSKDEWQKEIDAKRKEIDEKKKNPDMKERDWKYAERRIYFLNQKYGPFSSLDEARAKKKELKDKEK